MQRKTLQEMLLAAQRAKDDYTNVQRTAREAIGLGGQSFFSGRDKRGVSAFPSQSKTLLLRNTPHLEVTEVEVVVERENHSLDLVVVACTPGPNTLRANM
jgi:hypothetical protein